jgi:GAF domain/Restriction endonuclease
LIMDSLRAISAHSINHPEEALEELLRLCCKSFGAPRAVAVAFDGSDSNPRARRILYCSDGDGRAQVLHGSEDFPCVIKDIKSSAWLSYEELSQIGKGWLDTFIGGPSLFISCIGRPLGFSQASSLKSGAIVVGPVQQDYKIDKAFLEALSIVAGFALLEMDRAKAYATLHALGLPNAVRSRVRGTLTAEEIGQEVLSLLKEAIRFEAGVLYLLDEDPARNEYMVYCASTNEGSKHLFTSYYPREGLGITWQAAKLRRPIVGGLEDVPEEARHSNDPAWEKVSAPLHTAWALVPLVHLGRPIGVMHLEGINNGRGISRRQYELLQILSLTLGEAISKWQLSKETNPELYPSVDLVARLYSITDALGSRDPLEFEHFVRSLFLGAPGVTVLTRTSRAIPQSDVIFEVPFLGIRVVVEAKCLETAKKRVGSDAIRQLMAEMNAHNAEVGILASCNTLSSLTAESAARGLKILILDLQRLKRLATLSSETRGNLIRHWLTKAQTGIDYFPDVSSTSINGQSLRISD